jgi:hypothetical protein
MANRLKALQISTILAGVGAVSYFLYFWQWNYSSDTALVGMVARRLLSHGELPIFVGVVGYQGLLLEVPMAAALFKVFGSSPRVLDLVPAFFYTLLLAVFYRVVRVSFSPTVGWLSVLFLILSPPQWYAVVLRSIPNYPQTYFFGLLLFLLYRKILAKLIAGNRDFVPEAVGFGLLSGFSLYLYGQVIYFLFAIALHASFFYLRAEYQREHSLLKVVLPATKGLRGLLLVLAGGLLTLSFLTEKPIALGGRHKLDFMVCSFLAGLLFATVHGIQIGRHFGRLLASFTKIGALVLAVFIVGYFPKIYYNLVLGLRSVERLSLGGSFSDLVFRTGLLWRAMGDCYGFAAHGSIFLLMPLFLLGCLVFFMRQQFGELARFIRGEVPLENFDRVSFLFCLFWGTLGPLLASPLFSTLPSQRYAFALFLPVSLAMAFTVNRIRDSARDWKRPAVAVAATLFLCVCIYNFRIVRSDVGRLERMRAIVSEMQRRQINEGYADYWLATSLNFLYPEIKLEPLYTNYFPYFETEVREARRIALLDPQDHAPISDGKVHLSGNAYRVVESLVIEGHPVLFLERL